MAMMLQVFMILEILKIPKADWNHTCLAVVNLDSALKKDYSNYPLLFLNECKYIEKKSN